MSRSTNIAYYAFLFHCFAFAICTLGQWAHVEINNRFNVWHVRTLQTELQCNERMHFRVESSKTLNDNSSALWLRTLIRREQYMSHWHTLSMVVLIKIQFKLKCDNAITVYCAFGRWNGRLSHLGGDATTASLLASGCADFSAARRSMSPHKRVSPHNQRWSALALIRTQRQRITFNRTVWRMRFVTKEKESIQLIARRVRSTMKRTNKSSAAGAKKKNDKINDDIVRVWQEWLWWSIGRSQVPKWTPYVSLIIARH